MWTLTMYLKPSESRVTLMWRSSPLQQRRSALREGHQLQKGHSAKMMSAQCPQRSSLLYRPNRTSGAEELLEKMGVPLCQVYPEVLMSSVSSCTREEFDTV